MLCDFAITPQSIEQGEACDLAPHVAEGMNHLLRNLLNMDAKHLVVLSDVCAGKLSKRLYDLSKALTRDGDKKLVNAFRKELGDVGVSRPVSLVNESEEMDAISSAIVQPIADRIIVSRENRSSEYFCWEETKEVEFYRPVFPWGRQSPKIGDMRGQIDWLAPILARADFMVLILPYFYVRQASPQMPPMPGGDVGFALALASHWRSLGLTSWNGSARRLDIRTNLRVVDSKESGRAPDQRRAMESMLKPFPGTNIYWDQSKNSKDPHLDRRLLAGVFKGGRDDYRWGVNLGHPANSDVPNQSEPASFAPMNREDTAACAGIVRSFGNLPMVTA